MRSILDANRRVLKPRGEERKRGWVGRGTKQVSETNKKIFKVLKFEMQKKCHWEKVNKIKRAGGGRSLIQIPHQQNAIFSKYSNVKLHSILLGADR